MVLAVGIANLVRRRQLREMDVGGVVEAPQKPGKVVLLGEPRELPAGFEADVDDLLDSMLGEESKEALGRLLGEPDGVELHQASREVEESRSRGEGGNVAGTGVFTSFVFRQPKRTSSPHLLVLRLADGRDDLIWRWGAAGPIDDAPVFADDDHRPADTVPLRLQRIVGARDVQPFVNQEVEGQLLLLDERQVTGGVRWIDPVGFGVNGSKRLDGAAHGGELVRSASCAIGRVEEERGAPFPAQLGEIESRPGRSREREFRSYLSNGR
jgi:hypothetical protein